MPAGLPYAIELGALLDLLVAWRVKAALELAVGPGTAGTLFAAVVLVLGFLGCCTH